MPFGLTVEQLTPAGLLGLAFLMLMTGLLLPRWVYSQKDRECERWRKAYELEREGRIIADRQTATLLEGQQADHKVILAILENSEKLLVLRRPDEVVS